MKLYCCFTLAHRILFDDYFLPSVPKTFSVVPTSLEIDGAGDFLSREFIQCIWQKIDLVLESITKNIGDVIVWSDIDIQFFDLVPETLLSQLGVSDIAFQREGHKTSDVNTGFFICRCNERTTAFFERVGDALRHNVTANEQYVVNQLLKARVTDLAWTYLPFAYYARTHGWPPPRKLALYHANATVGPDCVQRKIRQFRELAFLRRFGISALLLTSIKYAPKRLRRLLSNP